jgi:putative transposase
MQAFATLRPQIGIAASCVALSINRAGIYRARTRLARRQWCTLPRKRRPRPPLALSEHERGVLLLILNSERFADLAPAAVFAILLDEGRYHGSIRTMYRILALDGQSGERRKQRVHTAYAKPELLAIRPNEVWSWDITKLKGPAKWTCFHLYVILDIFSPLCRRLDDRGA